ncbi:MAG: hypothetical protein HQ521_18625 [Bacteroidetes bacterium]|nr:hypothetical protein [Bacteroidota bacterium]
MNNPIEKSEIEHTLQISKSSESYLKETSSWTFFFSILGAIFLGLMVIGSIAVSIIFSTIDNESLPPISGVIIGAVYFILSIVYFFPIYYLYKFSSNMKKAIEKKEDNNLELAFKNIKSHFKYMGIFTIIIIVIYVLIAILMLFSGMVNNFWQ